MPSGSSRCLATLAVLGSCVALAACGDGGDEADAPEIPAEAVAVVGDESISEQALADRVAAAGKPRTSGTTPEQQRQQALSLLIQEAALEQEAQERGVSVGPAEVRRRLAQARKQFPNARAFKRFLGGASREHLLFQLRLQLLSDAIARDVTEDGGNAKRYQQELQERIREQTACRDESAAPACAPPVEREK